MIRNLCNQNCVHCPNPQLMKRGVFSTTTKEDIILQIDNAYKEDKRVVFTGGGEPTMCKYLPSCIKYAKDIGVRDIGIETNGVLLYYTHYVRKLKENGLDYCVISLHSYDEGVSDRITQMRGGFNFTIRGVENIKKEGIELRGILHTISAYNYKDIVKFLKFCKEILGVSEITISFIRPMGGDTESQSITPKISVVLPYLIESFEYALQNRIKVSIVAGMGIPICLLNGYELFSDELISFIKYGKEIHVKKSYAYEKIKIDKCKNCAFNICCSGIQREYANIYGTSELKPVLGSVNHIIDRIRSDSIK